MKDTYRPSFHSINVGHYSVQVIYYFRHKLMIGVIGWCKFHVFLHLDLITAINLNNKIKYLQQH